MADDSNLFRAGTVDWADRKDLAPIYQDPRRMAQMAMGAGSGPGLAQMGGIGQLMRALQQAQSARDPLASMMQGRQQPQMNPPGFGTSGLAPAGMQAAAAPGMQGNAQPPQPPQAPPGLSGQGMGGGAPPMPPQAGGQPQMPPPPMQGSMAAPGGMQFPPQVQQGADQLRMQQVMEILKRRKMLEMQQQMQQQGTGERVQQGLQNWFGGQ